MYNKNQIHILQQELLKGCQILITVGVDANNNIYPVAYAIVEAESKASWLKGLIQDIASVFPSAKHRYYGKHIHENMKSQLKGGVYKDMLWNAARATTVVEFNKRMGQPKSHNSAIYDWLMKIPTKQWSRSHFLEYLMKRIVVVQKVIAKNVRPLTPTVTALFDAFKKAATDYIVDWNGGYLYQVTGPYKDQCVVNMDRKVSSYRKWELTRIPCKHVVAAIYMSENGMGVGKVVGVKVVQVKLVALVNRVKEQDKLLMQAMSLVKLLVLVNRVNHKHKLLVQGMPQIKLLVLVNRVNHKDKLLVQGMPQVF
ncbi:hypothetical protein Tco_0383334 [Tanacetum coccineum]